MSFLLKNKRQIAKRWGGYAPSVIDAISRHLLLEGFSGREFDKESGHFFLLRNATDDLVLQIDLSPFSAENNVVAFTSHIGIASLHVRHVINELRLWECGDTLGTTPEVNRKPMSILGVGLEWLKWNANPSTSPFFWRVEPSNTEQIAEQWALVWQEYGQAFVDQANTVEKLIWLLSNLESYPVRVKVNGLRCTGRSNVLAILLHYVGRISEALQVLEKNMEEARAKKARGELHLSAEAKVLCEAERLRGFFMRSNEPGNLS